MEACSFRNESRFARQTGSHPRRWMSLRNGDMKEFSIPYRVYVRGGLIWLKLINESLMIVCREGEVPGILGEDFSSGAMGLDYILLWRECVAKATETLFIDGEFSARQRDILRVNQPSIALRSPQSFFEYKFQIFGLL
ncbi:hypothetical protein TNCV_4914251 [Trichonephila clavipes]|nr:hypothetical protein TNCV_4914251 [Trichonephila clavipes]